MNITSTKTKLFLIRYAINLVIQVPNIRQIIVITDTILATRCIFNSSNLDTPILYIYELPKLLQIILL